MVEPGRCDATDWAWVNDGPTLGHMQPWQLGLCAAVLTSRWHDQSFPAHSHKLLEAWYISTPCHTGPASLVEQQSLPTVTVW
jgi:hypothetical protein